MVTKHVEIDKSILQTKTELFTLKKKQQSAQCQTAIMLIYSYNKTSRHEGALQLLHTYSETRHHTIVTLDHVLE